MRKERFCPKSTLPELSGSEGKTVTNRFDMAATTKPITTTFLRPNLERKKGSEVSRIQPKFLKKDERECLMKTN